MIEVKDVFQAVVDKKPADFAQGFDELMKDKIAAMVQDRKLELSTSLFGAPEAVDNDDDDDEQPGKEGDDNNDEKSEEGSEG